MRLVLLACVLILLVGLVLRVSRTTEHRQGRWHYVNGKRIVEVRSCPRCDSLHAAMRGGCSATIGI